MNFREEIYYFSEDIVYTKAYNNSQDLKNEIIPAFNVLDPVFL